MDWSKFLTPEAIAAYVTFIGTVLITSIGWIVANRLSKRKPNIIRVSRESATSLLEIPVKLRKNVKVAYKDNEVPAIFQTQFDVINLGEDVLDDVLFTIGHLSGKLVDVIIEDPLESSRHTSFKTEGDEVKITLPFINPYGSLKDQLRVTILSNEEISDWKCFGGGKAWKTDYVDMLGLRINYVTILAKVDPRNPAWMYQYLTSSFEIFTKFLKL